MPFFLEIPFVLVCLQSIFLLKILTFFYNSEIILEVTLLLNLCVTLGNYIFLVILLSCQF